MGDSPLSNRSMYETVMGESFGRLAPAIQRSHRLSGEHTLHGWVTTQAPASMAAKLLARLIGTPLKATTDPDREVWTRNFPTTTMRSTLRFCGLQMEEHLDPSRLKFALLESSGTLVMGLDSLRFLGLPCPGWPLPKIVANESG